MVHRTARLRLCRSIECAPAGAFIWRIYASPHGLTADHPDRPGPGRVDSPPTNRCFAGTHDRRATGISRVSHLVYDAASRDTASRRRHRLPALRRVAPRAGEIGHGHRIDDCTSEEGG